jgi:hypothetical protein
MWPLLILKEPPDTILMDPMRAILHYEQTVIPNHSLLRASTEKSAARSHEDTVVENLVSFGESVTVVAFAHEDS